MAVSFKISELGICRRALFGGHKRNRFGNHLAISDRLYDFIADTNMSIWYQGMDFMTKRKIVIPVKDLDCSHYNMSDFGKDCLSFMDKNEALIFKLSFV